MSKYPLANVVSRALKRDAGIITTPPYKYRGYHVSGRGDYPTSISVDLTDLLTEHAREDVAAAADLHAHLTEHGWELKPLDPTYPTWIRVLRVPSAAEARAHKHGNTAAGKGKE